MAETMMPKKKTGCMIGKSADLPEAIDASDAVAPGVDEPVDDTRSGMYGSMERGGPGMDNMDSTASKVRGISSQFVAGPEIPDYGAAVATRCQRTVTFFLLCQFVQMFMSYDSGATSASLDTIMAAQPGYWTTSDLSLLGAMDKIGTVASSVFWGKMLCIFPTKCLLIIALAINASCTLMFGLLDNKYGMYATKFAMGATQALQNIWGSVWTVTMAPPDRVTMWMALGGVSAALGTGLGSGVSGFGTANGLPYSFAFILQASILFAFLIVQMITPAKRLAMTLPQQVSLYKDMAPTSSVVSVLNEDGEHRTPKTDDPVVSELEKEHNPNSTCNQMRELWNDGIYIWTLLATCLNQFQVQAIQYFFILIFCGAWDLNKNFATSMTITVPGIGLGVGIAFGPAYIDRCGGFSTPEGMYTSLAIMQNIAIVIAIGSVVGFGAVYGKLRAVDNGEFNESDFWLYAVWIALGIVCAGHSACVAALTGINTATITPANRSVASGVETAMRNMLGYFAGTLLPGCFMDSWAWYWKYDLSDKVAFETAYVYCYGLYFIFAFGVFQYPLMLKAGSYARQRADWCKAKALEDLRNAFISEDIEILKRAMVFAKLVQLNTLSDGLSVMGMAMEAIAQYEAGEKVEMRSAQAKELLCLSVEELVKKCLELEAELNNVVGARNRLKTRLDTLENEEGGRFRGRKKAEKTVRLQDTSPTSLWYRAASIEN